MSDQELKELSEDGLLKSLSEIDYQTGRWALAMNWCRANSRAPAGEGKIFASVRSGNYINQYTKTLYIVSCVSEIKVSAVQVQETEKQYKLSERTTYRDVLHKKDRNKILEMIVKNGYFMYSDNIGDILYMTKCIKTRVITQHQKLIKASEDLILSVLETDVQYIDKNKFD